MSTTDPRYTAAARWRRVGYADKTWRCSFCGLMTTTWEQLAKHTLNVHTPKEVANVESVVRVSAVHRRTRTARKEQHHAEDVEPDSGR